MSISFDLLESLPPELECLPERPACFRDLAYGFRDVDNKELLPYRFRLLSELCEAIRDVTLGLPTLSDLVCDSTGAVVPDRLEYFIGHMIRFLPAPDTQQARKTRALYHSFYSCAIYYLLSGFDVQDQRLDSLLKIAKTFDHTDDNEFSHILRRYASPEEYLELTYHSKSTFHIMVEDLLASEIPEERSAMVENLKRSFTQFDQLFRSADSISDFSGPVKFAIETYRDLFHLIHFREPGTYSRFVFCLDEALTSLRAILDGNYDDPIYDRYEEALYELDGNHTLVVDLTDPSKE